MAFHDVRFPTDIGFGSQGGPGFATEVVIFRSGAEARNQDQERPRERWNVAYGVKEVPQMVDLLTFHYVRRGRYHGFRFQNPLDYQGTAEPIGTGDDTETEFQLIKRYDDEGGLFDRKICKPVTDTVHIYFDGVEQAAGWTCDYSTGLVTFDAAPTTGTVITADFEFDVPVRFDTDRCPIDLEDYKVGQAAVEIVELLL